MRKTLRPSAAVVAAAMAVAAPAAAQQKSAEVIHWWTSGGESAALREFAERFEAQGWTWVDTAIAGGQTARTQGINRIVGGNPPVAMQFNIGRQFEEIVEAGLLNPMDDVAEQGRWKELAPTSFGEAITHGGSIYAVPVNIHGQNWLFYNAAVLESAGVAPPESWDDVLAAAPALRETGVIPLAQGGEAWQERTLFNGVLVGVAGPEVYEAFWRDGDEATLRGDAFRRAAETFGELRALQDSGAAGRSWNLTAALVVSGQAAMQLMGDWAKGEFIAAGMTAGEDYGCTLLGENDALVIGGDVFVFPRTSDQTAIEAQRTLAEVMMSPEAQIAFNTLKGSMPVRSDVDVSSMDVCAQAGAERIRAGAHAPMVNILASSDRVGALDDVITQFWNNPGQDVDAFVADLIDAISMTY
jgi:glucose/mannose transport system substrate-binding protein